MNLGPWEILIIAAVIVMLFGARKMPQMAKSLGQSMRILKAETKSMRDDKPAPAGTAPVAEPAKHLPQAADVDLPSERAPARETAG